MKLSHKVLVCYLSDLHGNEPFGPAGRLEDESHVGRWTGGFEQALIHCPRALCIFVKRIFPGGDTCTTNDEAHPRKECLSLFTQMLTLVSCSETSEGHRLYMSPSACCVCACMCVCGWMDGWMDGWIGGWEGGWMDGWEGGG